MPSADAKAWLRGGLPLICAIVMPLVCPWPVTLAVVFLTPVWAECLRAAGLRWHGVIAGALITLGALLAGIPAGALQICGLWAVAAMAMTVVNMADRPVGRCIAWTAAMVLTLCAGLVMLRRHYSGAVCYGLAEDAVRIINQQDKAVEILLSAWKMGYARLEGDINKLPAMNVFGQTLMMPQVRVELVNSLRTTIEFTLTEQLPQVMVYYLMITALATAALSQWVLRRRGMEAKLPPVTQWHLPRGYASGAMVLAVFGLMRYMLGSTALYQAGAMSMAAFCTLYVVQGICLVVWWIRQGPQQMSGGVMLAAVVLLLLPMLTMLLTVLGVIDQIADPRGLREQDRIEM